MASNPPSTAEEEEEKKETLAEPILCRLCKGKGVDNDDYACVFCKGVGLCNADDVDAWTFADLDEPPLGPGVLGVVAPRKSYVPPDAEWHTWTEGEGGRGYIWAELRRRA